MRHGKMLFQPDGGSQSGSPPAAGDPPPKKEGDGTPPAGDPPPKKEGDGAPPPKKEGEGEPPKKTLLGDGEAPPPKKEGDGKPPAGVPEKYDLKLPKDSTLDPSITDKIAAQARSLGLSNEKAQTLLDSFNTEHIAQMDVALKAQQRGGAEWTKRVETWEGQIEKDPELGGEHLRANVTMGNRVLKTFFSKDVSDFLVETGYGSHPDILRALLKIGKAMGEDKLIAPEVPSDGGSTKVELKDKLFPTTAVKKE
jgi:hypothetical protein